MRPVILKHLMAVNAVKMEKYARRLMIEREMNKSIRMLARLVIIGCSNDELNGYLKRDLGLLLAVARLLHGDPRNLQRRVRELSKEWDNSEYSQISFEYMYSDEEEEDFEEGVEEE